MTYEILIPSNLLPVTVDEAKQLMHIDSNDDNAVIENLIKSAVSMFETATGYAILVQTWTLVFDVWPITDGDIDLWDGVRDGAVAQFAQGYVHIDKAPFNTVEKVETIDENGDFIEWDEINYYSIKNMKFGQLFASDVNWPAPARNHAGIKITFTLGHATAAQVPFMTKNAILQLVEHWFEKKPQDEPLPKAYLSAVASFRSVKI